MTEQQHSGQGDARERFEAFAGVIEDAFVPLDMTMSQVESFRGHARSGKLGAMYISEFAVGSAIVMKRTPRTIGRKAPEHLKINLQVRGSCIIEQDGRQALLSPGDFVLYDTTRPFRFASEDAFTMYGVIIPAELLRLPDTRLAQLTARPFNGRHGMGIFVSRFLRQVGGRLATNAHQDNMHLADATLDLLTASFVEHLSTDHNIRNSRGAGLLMQIRLFIDSKLDDPELGVTTIAAAHYISVRQLQKLFEDDGQTVTGWIRRRRIERCRKDLSNIAFADVPVGDICRRWGLRDAANFSKNFKAVYGLPPRDYRTQALKKHHQ